MRDLLGRLTARVIGAESPRGPLDISISSFEDGVQVRGRGGRSERRQQARVTLVGYGMSTAWDTPRGEAANLPRMLREATARQTRFAAEPGTRTKGGDAPELSVDHKAGDHLIRLQHVVARLALATSRASGSVPERATWGSVARWLDAEMTVIRMQDWAPTMLADLRRVMAAAERHVDRPPTRLYLGPCDKLVGDDVHGYTPCDGEYRSSEGESTAECTGCRTEVDVETRKRNILEDAASRWLTAVQIERLTAWLGRRVPDSTVVAWGSRKQIRQLRLDGEDGPWSYPLAEVLVRVEAAEAKTRRSA